MCDLIQINTHTFKAITLRIIGTNVVLSSGILVSIQKVCETFAIEQKIVSISDEGGALQNRQKGDISIKKNVSPNKTMATTPFLRKYLVLFEITDKEVNLNSACTKLMSLVHVKSETESSVSGESVSSESMSTVSVIDIESDSSVSIESTESESTQSIGSTESESTQSIGSTESESTQSIISDMLSADSDSSKSATSVSDSSVSDSSVSDSSESNTSESVTCVAPVFGNIQTTIDAVIGDYITFYVYVDPSPLNPPEFIVNNLPNGLSTYQQPGGDFIIYGNPQDLGNYTIDVTAYYNECSGLQSNIQLFLNVSVPCYVVSGTGTQYDGNYNPVEQAYVHYDYDSLLTQVINGSSPQGPKYLYRHESNSNLAIFWHDTYQIWAISDLTTYNSGPPEAGLYAGNYGAPPTGSWYSPMYATDVQSFACAGNNGFNFTPANSDSAWTGSSGNYTSGPIADGQTSAIEWTGYASHLFFNWNVGSENCCDFFEFYIDGNLMFSGVGGDSNSYENYPNGTYTFRWVYRKSGSSSIPPDQAVINGLVITP
jgi:hypothetical protein